MANRLFQGVIHQMKDAIDRSFGVIDENYIVIASSDLSRIGETVLDEMPISDSFVSGGLTYKVISSNQGAKYMVYVEGEDALAARYANVLAVSFSNIKFYYDEKYDRSNFIKNIILDNILPGDIYLKARELHKFFQHCALIEHVSFFLGFHNTFLCLIILYNWFY